jgi:hypothetical protein
MNRTILNAAQAGARASGTSGATDGKRFPGPLPIGPCLLAVLHRLPKSAHFCHAVLTRANHTTSFFLVSGFGSGPYSAKLLAGTRQRFSGLSHMRQCGQEVLRMLVTGGPPVRGGDGMPHRIVANSRPVSVLRMTGAG